MEPVVPAGPETAPASFASVFGFRVRSRVSHDAAGPNAPPNHGTVVLACDAKRYIVDASILHGEPLPLEEQEPSAPMHPAWGAQLRLRDGQRIIRWRPLHKPEGFDCRINELGSSEEVFRDLYEQSRSWSPLSTARKSGRLNQGDSVIGTVRLVGFGIQFNAAGRCYDAH